MLLILAPSVTNRLIYITSLLLKTMLGIEVRLTTSRDEFASHDGPKFNYSGEPMAEGLFIAASDLLFQKDVIPQPVNVSGINGIPVIFGSGNPLSGLQFDPFAASFYMISRYEEYHTGKRDVYGRFQAEESVAWKGKFLENPIVHSWAEMLKDMLSRKFPGLVFRQPEYRFVPTIDIDHAWCYLGRTVVRTAGGFARSLIQGRPAEIAARFSVLTGKAADPYDNYDFITGTHRQYADLPLYFILYADYGGHDNNVVITTEKFQQLIRELQKCGQVGIHPSFASNESSAVFVKEYNGLCRMLGSKVTISRQHFLKFSMPGTFRNLARHGITDDYSMAYASHSGFRAGIAMPFHFFDLLNDESTSLVIHPVSVMDVTMRDYLRLNRVESLEMTEKMIRSVKAVHGEFISLWHNESLGDTGRWEGWRDVYTEMVKLAST